MEDTIECPKCGTQTHCDVLDETGAHYECPNCDNTWTDDSIKADVSDEEE